MRRGTWWLAAVATAAVVWAVFTWPLPRYFFSGIPSSDRNVEKYHVRAMISGDHLQLLYHFWLASDMIAGKTPAFVNLYEFNTGDDEARFRLDPYYAPFSLVYALAAPLGGRAFGWNVTGFLAILLTFLFTWRLARRYARAEWTAWLAALVGFTMPYRWITLLTGSPTGFAMTLVPALLLGIDLAVRDGRAAGGVLAGGAMFLAFCSDLHVFFFSGLVAPLWVLVALTAGPVGERESPRMVRRVLALLPALVLGIVTLVVAVRFGQEFAGTDISGGRSWNDVNRFSPSAHGLISWDNLGVSNHVFFGSAAFALLLSGAGVMLYRAVRKGRTTWRTGTTALWLYGALAATIVLALGAHGPMDGLAIRICRKIIPRYDMIRQPVKIFCLMPSLVAVAGAMALTAWTRLGKLRALGVAVLALLSLGTIVESRCQVSPTICLLDRTQEAYRAVAEDAQANERSSRILVLPLWPGDSHFTSLYQYYASLYRLKMVNGYSPVKDEDYYRNVFQWYESANQGSLSDVQLDELIHRGVPYIIFQEGPFPEKVSPFPPGLTLKRLLNHPRLELLRQDGIAWAFRILAAPVEDRPERAGDWVTWAPARVWQAESWADAGAVPTDEVAASEGKALPMTGRMVAVVTHGVVFRDTLRWMLRLRGIGVLGCYLSREGLRDPERIVTSQYPQWKWVGVPMASSREFANRSSMVLHSSGGDVLLDMIVLAAGEWPRFAAGEPVNIPAPCVFRSGYTDLEDGSVVFRHEREADRTVLYGPRLPLPVGDYTLSLDYDSPAAPDTLLGRVRLEGRPEVEAPLLAGRPFSVTFTQEYEVPFSFRLDFSRNGDLRVRTIVIERQATPEGAGKGD